MNPEHIKAWLDKIGQTRDWLGKQCGSSKPTVDGWLSADRPIPRRKADIIARLMRDVPSAGSFKVSFEAEEFERIEAARAITGHANRPDFYHDAITDFADRILASERAATAEDPKITPIHYGSKSAAGLQKVAEEASDEQRPQKPAKIRSAG